jgi:hypothetical protein
VRRGRRGGSRSRPRGKRTRLRRVAGHRGDLRKRWAHRAPVHAFRRASVLLRGRRGGAAVLCPRRLGIRRVRGLLRPAGGRVGEQRVRGRRRRRRRGERGRRRGSLSDLRAARRAAPFRGHALPHDDDGHGLQERRGLHADGLPAGPVHGVEDVQLRRVHDRRGLQRRRVHLSAAQPVLQRLPAGELPRRRGLRTRRALLAEPVSVLAAERVGLPDLPRQLCRQLHSPSGHGLPLLRLLAGARGCGIGC